MIRTARRLMVNNTPGVHCHLARMALYRLESIPVTSGNAKYRRGIGGCQWKYRSTIERLYTAISSRVQASLRPTLR
jgi:hypothetical protein